MTKRSFAKYALLLSFGVVLTILTMVLAAIPMRVARRTYGRGLFWVGHLLAGSAMIMGGAPVFGIAFLVIAVSVGAYAEFEELGGSAFGSGFLSLLITMGASAVGVALWMRATRTDLVLLAREHVSRLAEQMTSVNGGTAVDVEMLLRQLPSALVVLLMLALAASLVWEKRGYLWLRLPQKEARNADLAEFRVPDPFVWIAMGAILGAFLNHEVVWLEAVSLNAINVLVVLYFFQGLAVVSRFFAVFKVNVFWQGFWYILIAIQLFLLVSLLGFVDFWVDFRDRLAKKTAEINKGF